MAENEIQVRKQNDKKIPTIRPYEHKARYSEVDMNGTVHHSYYVNWMENARMHLMEELGLGLKQMEEMQVLSTVLSMSIEYHSPVKFNETVIVEPSLISYDGYQMEIAYRITDKETGEDRAVARSKHTFMNIAGIPISMKRIYPELETKFFEFK